jgi:CRISPR-associated Cas5-like protein
MVWAYAKYSFASTFSYRIPYFSSSYAISAPVPGPSTIKLALVASAINRDGNVEIGKRLFEKIRDSAVTVELPEKLIAFKAFMKRFKQKRKGKEITIKTSFGELVERFEYTFGIREYIIYGGPINIYIEVSDESFSQEIMRYFKAIQYFGSSDSICTCLETGISDPDWQKCIRQANAEGGKIQNKGMIFLLTDFTAKATFDSINPFSGKKPKKGELLLKPYFFPIEVVEKDKNCVVYKRL